MERLMFLATKPPHSFPLAQMTMVMGQALNFAFSNKDKFLHLLFYFLFTVLPRFVISTNSPINIDCKYEDAAFC